MEITPEVSPILSVQLFGNFELRRDDIVLTSADMGGCKPRHILEILLLNFGSAMSKDGLIEVLWGRHAPDGAVATLESYVCCLRRLVQPGRTRTGPLRTANGGYVLDTRLVDSDLDRFHRLVHEADSAPPAAAYPLLRRAIDMSAVPLLGNEVVPEWANEARLRIASQRLELQVRAAETANALDLPLEAIPWAQAALDADGLNERAWTALVTAYELAGLYAEGLSSYDRCRRTFHRELACSPGSALQALYVRLLRQTAEAEGDLSEALEALICIGQRLRGNALPSGRPGGGLNFEGAEKILDSFLRRAHRAV